MTLRSHSRHPAGWKLNKVVDLFTVVGGGTPSTAVGHFWNGSIPWISSADIDASHHVTLRRSVTADAVRSSATNVVPAGSVIVATRVGLGKVGIAVKNMCFSQDCQALLFSIESFDPHFVLYQMSIIAMGFLGISRGTTISGITKKQLLDAPFLLVPRAEQSRVVEAIESYFTRLDEAVSTLERVGRNLKRYRASVLQAAVEGTLSAKWRQGHPHTESPAELIKQILTERRRCWEGDQLRKFKQKGQEPPKNWKAKYKEPIAPDTTKLPPLPEDWCWVSVGQASAIIVDCPHSTPRFVDLGHPCVDTTCIKPGLVIRQNLRYVSTDTYRSRISRLIPQGGDIVFAREGTVGTAVRLPDDIRPCLGQRVMLMRPNKCILSEYFEISLNSYVVQTQYRPKLLGSTVNHLNVGEAILLAIPLPPLEEQEAIVEIVEDQLSVIEHVETDLDATLKNARTLRQAILKLAFSGRLVDQYPRDEPASTLVERIRAERAAAGAATTTRRPLRRRRAKG